MQNHNIIGLCFQGIKEQQTPACDSWRRFQRSLWPHYTVSDMTLKYCCQDYFPFVVQIHCQELISPFLLSALCRVLSDVSVNDWWWCITSLWTRVLPHLLLTFKTPWRPWLAGFGVIYCSRSTKKRVWSPSIGVLKSHILCIQRMSFTDDGKSTCLQFFPMLTNKIFTCHNFWNLTIKYQIHTPNLQNHTLILGLWLYFSISWNTFCKTQHTIL